MLVPASTAKAARFAGIASVALTLIGAHAGVVEASAPVYDYEVINVFPHAEDAYTQGLIFGDGYLYEGTGGYGESSLRKVEIDSGTVVKQFNLPEEYFGEGITALRDTIYQLTWTNHVAFAYEERDTFAIIETYPYEWNGWGLTHDGTHLIASDGSSILRFLDPRSCQEVSQIQVHDDGSPVGLLNELEYIQGRIYSNVWFRDDIAVIDPVSGEVEAWLDLGGLRDSVAYHPDAGVLNGIAFDPGDVRLFVTGKQWPLLFEIDVPTLHPEGVDDEGAPGWTGPLVVRGSPNPCRRRTQLSFILPDEGSVILRIFDADGRLVHSVVSDGPGPGMHDLPLDTSVLHPGAYFVRFFSGETVGTGKLLVVR